MFLYEVIMNKTKRNFLISGLLFVLFAIFTLLVKIVDVKPIGPQNSSVGFSSVNKFFFELFGKNHTWYNITELLGYLSFAFVGLFGLIGAYQLVKRKSLLKVDKEILALGVFYVLVALFYVLFEIIVINCRPVLMEGVLEASYPSSHTMLAICIMMSSSVALEGFVKNKKIRFGLFALLLALSALMAFGRLASGVHWFTDIVASVLLSSALVMTYKATVNVINK